MSPSNDASGADLRVGISVPRGIFDASAEERRSVLSSMADLGIDHIFTPDHVSFRGGGGVDAVTQLAAISGVEPRLGLYLGVQLLALRHPMVAARQLADLAVVAPGRITHGVGVGGEDRHEFEVCGVDPATRGRRTDAAIEIVQRLLRGETLEWHDEFFELREASIRPVPTEPIPTVIGGRSNAALDRAARLGAGWLAAWCSARRLAEGVAMVEDRAAELGRADVPWEHGIQLWVGVGDHPGDGRRYVAEGMQRFYQMPFEPFERYTPVGSAADIAEFLAPYVDAGARVVNLTPVGASPEHEIETIAEVKRLLLG